MSLRDEYEDLMARYAAAVGRGDAAGVAGLYAEDALLLEPGAPMVAGRAAIRQLYADWLDGAGATLEVAVEDIQDRGDTVYGTGRFTNPDGSGKWLQVLQRRDGALLIHRQCWNPG